MGSAAASAEVKKRHRKDLKREKMKHMLHVV